MPKKLIFKPYEIDSCKCTNETLLINYVKSIDNRFDEICDLYLSCLRIEDIEFLKPEDLICLVPSTQINHKALMTTLVRRYIYAECDDDDDSDCNDNNSTCC